MFPRKIRKKNVQTAVMIMLITNAILVGSSMPSARWKTRFISNNVHELVLF